MNLTPDNLTPDLKVLCKIGSIVRHCEEALSPNDHVYDATALKTLLEDQDVQDWLKEMDKAALIPVK